jgi:hypothetical protein
VVIVDSRPLIQVGVSAKKILIVVEQQPDLVSSIVAVYISNTAVLVSILSLVIPATCFSMIVPSLV